MEVVEGKILRVMESWPLQLVVETPSGRLDVALSDETAVIQEGRSVSPSVLTSGAMVIMRGDPSPKRPTAFTAREIEVSER